MKKLSILAVLVLCACLAAPSHSQVATKARATAPVFRDATVHLVLKPGAAALVARTNAHVVTVIDWDGDALDGEMNLIEEGMLGVETIKLEPGKTDFVITSRALDPAWQRKIYPGSLSVGFVLWYEDERGKSLDILCRDGLPEIQDELADKVSGKSFTIRCNLPSEP